jgi:D-alanine-D-alanine ligase
MPGNPEQWVQRVTAQLRSQASQFAVFLVANIKNITVVQDDYEGFSVHNDYMTEQVIDEIVRSLRDSGLFVQLFVGEDAFIHAVLNRTVECVERPKKLVYNLAQTGTGPARKALVPTFCNLHCIPCSNSDGHVVALLRHKYHATSILRDHGFSVPRTWFFLQTGEWLRRERPPAGLKIIVKATYEAASIGLSKDCVRLSDDSLDEFARAHARILRQPLTVQEFIDGYEVEVPIISAPDPYAPSAIGVSINGIHELGSGFLDYNCLDERAYGFYYFDQEKQDLATQLCRVAEDAATVLGIAGVGRIDFRATRRGSYYVTDMQTMPDIYKQSSVYVAMNRSMVDGDPYTSLVAINCARLGLL